LGDFEEISILPFCRLYDQEKPLIQDGKGVINDFSRMRGPTDRVRFREVSCSRARQLQYFSILDEQ
jgi:hypothetical protein